MRERRANNPEMKQRAVEYTARWKAANPEAHAAQQARKHTKHKDTINANTAAWKKENPDKVHASIKARKTRLRVSGSDRAAMRAFYLDCPDSHVVDHTIPLNNENVSGLHCLANLQYLSVEENSFKSNKFDGTYENEGWRKPHKKA